MTLTLKEVKKHIPETLTPAMERFATDEVKAFLKAFREERLEKPAKSKPKKEERQEVAV